MSVNDSAISERLKLYFESEDCKQKIKDKIKEYVDSGTAVTGSGETVIDKRLMKELSNALVRYVIYHATSKNLPESVLNDVKSLKYNEPFKYNDSYYCVEFNFTNDLSRPSLYADNKAGEQIDNIIALFNTGAKADGKPMSDHVRGFWDGHPHDWSLDKDMAAFGHIGSGDGKNYAFIQSAIQFNRLNFMQNAINDFMRGYAKKYDIVIELNPIYEDGSR